MDRLLFAAPRSGSGKTMVVCGLIRDFQANGEKTKYILADKLIRVQMVVEWEGKSTALVDRNLD